MSTGCEFVIDDDTLAELAYLRAVGRSWESAAGELGRSAADLRRAARRHPGYADALSVATREVEFEAAAELVSSLRARLRDPDAAIAQPAAETLAKHLADRGRDRTGRKSSTCAPTSRASGFS